MQQADVHYLERAQCGLVAGFDGNHRLRLLQLPAGKSAGRDYSSGRDRLK